MASKWVPVLLMFYMSASTCGIQLRGNGYTDILIAINHNVPDDPALIHKIQEMVSDASKYLFEAMDNKFYFKNVTILVPPHWSGNYSRANTETYEKANIRIDEPNKLYGNEPYTLQYGECGNEGRYIHLTPAFLNEDELTTLYGPRGRALVHEWAHLRWGVYDEYDEKKTFYMAGGKLEATRCSRDISGSWHSVSSGALCTPKDTGTATDCQFFPNKHQTTSTSIMYLQSIDSVVKFCNKDNHNTEAPNMQNRMCGGRSVEEVLFSVSVDSNSQANNLPPPCPATTFSVIQRLQREVCLVLDVSGSMAGQRITRQLQAATLFLKQIIEDQSYVGIVTFNSIASILQKITLIDSVETRNRLIASLPKIAQGGTLICEGLHKGLEVLKERDGLSNGKEIIFLTDGESNKAIDCLETAKESGAIIHTIALGPNGDKLMVNMSTITNGKYFYAGETLNSNELVDVFASLTTSDGDLSEQAIQLESIGFSIKGSEWYNHSVSIDKTVGKNTSFLILYESNKPLIFVLSPSGEIFDSFQHDSTAKSLTLDVPGIAEAGVWNYSIMNIRPGISETVSLTVTSRAASKEVAPVMVKAHMSQKSSNGSKPMVVFAEVSQKGRPVILAEVIATLESDAGDKEELQLLDNGANADAFRNDGIYSKYFTRMKGGKYNLKVRVQNGDGKARFSLKRHNGAMYIPGYVADGKVELNPPKPPVSEEDLQVDVGSFSRTAIGESFIVDLPPGVSTTTKFPPNKITDLNAELEGDKVLLSWTAPGDDYDLGTAKTYEFRYSEDPGLLRSNFSDARPINMFSLQPSLSGSSERFSFTPGNRTMKNGTTLFFAAQAIDNDALSSETSNLAQVTKVLGPLRSPGNGVDIKAIVIPVTVLTIVAGLIASVTMAALKRKK